MKVTSFIAHFFKTKGITTVFELQGGMITRIIDEIYQLGGIKIVSMHHEQAAAFAADAYGRITNKPGIALATSGPGATNLITGIGNCYFDSVPAIFITGQVNIIEQKGDKLTRQIGFQETDIVSIVKPITKKAYAIKSAKEIPGVFREAYELSLTGRPGPVLIDIPMNIQNEEVDNLNTKSDISLETDISKYKPFFEGYINVLKKSKRPLILVGRGIRSSGAVSLFKEFLEKIQLPVVTSLLGFDVLPFIHSRRIGFIGTYGNRWANYALGSCDLLLVLGSRLDLRQTGSDIPTFQKGKKIYHVDIDESELNNRITNCEVLKTDLNSFLRFANNYENNYNASIEWEKTIREIKEFCSDTKELENINGINPNVFIHKLSQTSNAAKTFVVDVGNNQMWCAQSLELNGNQIFLTSGGMGAMGYALPAAIGACFSNNNLPVIAIAGDGGFQINIQELQTIRRNNLPVKIVILNNQCLGMIRQFQDSYFDSCYQSTVWGYSAPDFESVAHAYHINSTTISTIDQIDNGLKQMWEKVNEPFLLNVMIDIHTNVYPKMLFGNPLTSMEPIKNLNE